MLVTNTTYIMKTTQIILLFALFTLTACSSDTLVNERSDIEDALQVHFREFQDQARQRGVAVDYRDIDMEAYITNIQRNGVIGTCTQFGTGEKEIAIDENYWRRSSHLGRELVVFHELGHCILQRGHNEAEGRGNTCLSIMNSGTSGCRTRYTAANRDFYIDELFNSD